jgi:hypothetical protein
MHAQGFRIYVDGVFRAALQSPQNYFQVDGGQPIYADGPIVLCDRADHAPGRTFDGRIAQLSVFDAALTENNVRAPPLGSCSPQKMPCGS